MQNEVVTLNARLGERLGYRGSNPRFAWQYAPDLFYFWRDSYLTGFQRHCWAERLGRVWVLCQWRRPEMSQQEWWNSFRGEFPYPAQGMYYAHPETALDVGQLPTAEITVAHIAALEQQIAKSHAQHLAECKADADQRTAAKNEEWDQFVADWEPAVGGKLNGGGRGANTAFQVPGLRNRIIQPATEDSPELREHCYIAPDGSAVSSAHYL